jgi:iron-sulfur cluster repair protein YtfE (RIC family)
MSVATEPFHEAHDALRAATGSLRKAAADLPNRSPSERVALRDSLLPLLSTVESHMRRDERIMYPEVARQLRDPLATASMNYDHLSIRHWLREIRAASVDCPEPLQELLYGLDALIRVHLWKEDELYLHMLESPLWPAA